MATRREPAERFRLDPQQLRWRCDPGQIAFETTADIRECPINIIGQPRAEEALRLGLSSRAEGYNIFVSGDVGSGRSTVVRHMLARLEHDRAGLEDLVYVHNFADPDRPWLLRFPAGRGKAFRAQVEQLIESLRRDLPKLFESEVYRKRRVALVEAASTEQKARLKEFEKHAQSRGFALTQTQMGPFVRSQLVPVVAGNPVDIDQLETLVEQGQFRKQDYDSLLEAQAGLRAELEGLGREIRGRDRELQRELQQLDREIAEPAVHEATADVAASFAEERVAAYLRGVAEDVLARLEQFREVEPGGPSRPPEPATKEEHPRRYAVNVVVDNSETAGPPVIRETDPSYRNLFGTVDTTRGGSGEWQTDHTRIKPGSLLRANGGFLVLDAIDVLVEPGVWAALKRTLRHRQVEIRLFDPIHLFSGVSIKPEPAAVDVKVLMIGTRQIYRLLHALDEDFTKIFKIKAEFATTTPNNPEEITNYACLIHKRCTEEQLLPFHRGAVAAVVEHAVRVAGHQRKLTTRFTEMADVIREAGYWAARVGAARVEAEHVERAVQARVYRVDLIEERLRERIAEGSVLLDLQGSKVAQVNGLAVIDVGDHAFGQPSRITATTAMGRAGIIDIDREAEMSGAIHTKGVLILAGFLRERFAQRRPLALTASLTFEQSYGGVEGDSASCAELYALLSSLADVPLRQGIAITGSVNQRGEVQPIGGINEKIEGYFDLCRLIGLTGEQGVLVPRRNLPQLMLRKDVVEAVRDERFHVWAVGTIEEGLEVLAGVEAGERGADGGYPPRSIFGRADARLARLVEELARFGPADGGAIG